MQVALIDSGASVLLCPANIINIVMFGPSYLLAA